MGKGNRNRIAKAQERAEKQKEQEKLRRRQKRIKIAAAILVPCFAVVLIGAIVLGSLSAAGKFLRSTISVTSDSYEIDNAMMSYFFNSQVQYYLSNTSSSSIDQTKSLKSQKYSDSQTWFDYFMASTKAQVQRLVVLAEAAKAEGMELTAEEKESIESQLNAIDQQAQAQGTTFNKYIASIYGNGVTREDVQRCLELYTLANSFYEQKYNGFTYSDEVLESYFEENQQTLTVYSYKSYTINAEFDIDASDDVKNEALAAAKASADELAACTTSEAFDAWVEAFLKETGEDDEEEIAKTLESTLNEDTTYSSSSEIAKWAYEDGRKAGDTKVIEGTNKYTVALLVKAPAREEYLTKNVRHILFTEDTYGSAEAALNQATTVRKEFSNGEQTAEAFGALAEKYSEDTGSSTNGGQYLNIRKGQMVEAFEDWCFDEARTVGETGIVETDYGYHLMYFEGDGDIAWKAKATEAKRAEDYEALYETYESQYAVSFSDKLLDRIRG